MQRRDAASPPGPELKTGNCRSAVHSARNPAGVRGALNSLTSCTRVDSSFTPSLYRKLSLLRARRDCLKHWRESLQTIFLVRTGWVLNTPTHCCRIPFYGLPLLAWQGLTGASIRNAYNLCYVESRMTNVQAINLTCIKFKKKAPSHPTFIESKREPSPSPDAAIPVKKQTTPPPSYDTLRKKPSKHTRHTTHTTGP